MRDGFRAPGADFDVFEHDMVPRKPGVKSLIKKAFRRRERNWLKRRIGAEVAESVRESYPG